MDKVIGVIPNSDNEEQPVRQLRTEDCWYRNITSVTSVTSKPSVISVILDTCAISPIIHYCVRTWAQQRRGPSLHHGTVLYCRVVRPEEGLEQKSIDFVLCALT